MIYLFSFANTEGGGESSVATAAAASFPGVAAASDITPQRVEVERENCPKRDARLIAVFCFSFSSLLCEFN